jgi:hypothetical protein
MAGARTSSTMPGSGTSSEPIRPICAPWRSGATACCPPCTNTSSSWSTWAGVCRPRPASSSSGTASASSPSGSRCRSGLCGPLARDHGDRCADGADRLRFAAADAQGQYRESRACGRRDRRDNLSACEQRFGLVEALRQQSAHADEQGGVVLQAARGHDRRFWNVSVRVPPRVSFPFAAEAPAPVRARRARSDPADRNASSEPAGRHHGR